MATEQDTPVSTKIASPRKDGIYNYEGAAGTMKFKLEDGQWYVSFQGSILDDSFKHVEYAWSEWEKCEWGYIEQGCGVYYLQYLGPIDA